MIHNRCIIQICTIIVPSNAYKCIQIALRTQTLTKTGHGQHASRFVICVVLYVIRDVLLLIVMFYVLRVNVYCHRVPTKLQLTNISISILL
jgi:hypothetical protein